MGGRIKFQSRCTDVLRICATCIVENDRIILMILPTLPTNCCSNPTDERNLILVALGRPVCARAALQSQPGCADVLPGDPVHLRELQWQRQV